MKKIIFAIFILFPLLSFAQLQVIAGVGFMVVKQNGIVLVPSSQIPGFSVKSIVDRKLFTFGGTITGFYRLSRSPVPGKVSIGPQFGFGFHSTRLKKSNDSAYRPDPSLAGWKRTFGPINVPLEFAVRFGNMSDPENYPFGLSLAAGVDFFYLRLADEIGFAALPCGSVIFMMGKTGARLGFHLMEFRSVYNSNVGEVDRLTNSFTSFELVRAF